MTSRSRLPLLLTTLTIAATGCGGGGSTGVARPKGWTFTSLAPAGVTNCAVYAITPTYQAGSALLDGVNGCAVIWNGSPQRYVNLNPSGCTNSSVAAVSGNTQAGTAEFNGVAHAALWRGSAASFVDLQPDGATGSTLTATYGSDQGGSIFPGQQAAIWSGTKASMRNLNPIANGFSTIYGMGPNQQVGSYSGPGQYARACRWSGTVASMVDLNGSYPASEAFATDGAHQVGLVQPVPNANGNHACLWSGTAASLVDLHPTGADYSEAHAVAGPYQAGFAYIGGKHYASLWKGIAASWTNLNQYLPAGFDSAMAYSIVVSPSRIVVGGYAINTTKNLAMACIWTETL